MLPLSQDTSETIRHITFQANDHVKHGRLSDAIQLYWNAYDLIPDPKEEYEASTWVLGSIGDANFISGDFAAGKDNLSAAMHCPNAIGNPFLHLRLGQCQFELGDLERAADELTRAYMSAGAEIFQEDEKYYKFLQSKIQPPESGW